jgi:hypothetical protein
MTDPIEVPAAGEPEWQGEITEGKLTQVIGGLLIPNQAFAKAMARKLRECMRSENAPVGGNENFHFENDEVLAAIANTQYAKDVIARHLRFMTVDQKWSLYRAVVKLAIAARKNAAIRL